MKLRVRGETEEQEKIVEVWVEQDGNELVVKVERLGIQGGYQMARIKPEGLERIAGLPDDFGFLVDDKCRIKLIE